MQIDFLILLLVVLNLPALFAMVFLLFRNNKLRIHERISWTLLALFVPIISLVLFTVQIPGENKKEAEYWLHQ
jgi:hypothetical protein